MAGFRVAVVGATGVVGRTILQVLEERRFPVESLRALASPRSAGQRLQFHGQEIVVEALSLDRFAGCDVAFFSAGASVSQEFAPAAARDCALVVDNSSAFRADPRVPLVVPEVNGGVLASEPPYRGIVANPNCSTIQMVVALQPLHQVWGLESVVVSTYQSVSGAGARGVRALEAEVAGEVAPESPFSGPIAFNALPQIGDLDADGWSGEEGKMIRETRKIMDLPDLAIVPTTVRVPVRVAHSEAVYARFARPLSPERARTVLARAPSVVLLDDPCAGIFPTALMAAGSDAVYVGRVRQIPGDERGITLWVVSDNLRKGAATNAVQVAEAAPALFPMEKACIRHG